ncbi:hypothetical protein RB595_000205 [Gaeumannomyces hyphopodioides]
MVLIPSFCSAFFLLLISIFITAPQISSPQHQPPKATGPPLSPSFPSPIIKMQFKTIIVALFAGAAIAVPTGGGSGGSYDPCSGLYDSPQCCATDVLGVADLDCQSVPKVPVSANNFKDICADVGQRARCCILPVLGQGILCQTPVGV